MSTYTRKIKIGNIYIGNGERIAIQSMTNTDTADVESTLAQIKALESAGADIVRLSCYDESCIKAIKEIKKHTKIPLVADIHFDNKLAIAACESGIDKLRINPGNIGGREKVQAVVSAAKTANIPIRIGVNSGSVERELLQKYGGPTAQALAESALNHAKLLENEGFYDIVISIKASDVKTTVEANLLLSKSVDYPLHLGVTEAGLGESAIVKSSIGIGALLLLGIGDTIRVSITGDVVQEVIAAKQILRALDLSDEGYIDFISCPTCARTTGDLEKLVLRVKNELAAFTPKHKVKIAIMGCVVNGPGEAREADIGIAFAKKGAAVFKKGELVYSGDIDETIERFISDCKELIR